MTSLEIATMKKITQVYDDNKNSQLGQEMNYDGTPRILLYGKLNLSNLN